MAETDFDLAATFEASQRQVAASATKVETTLQQAAAENTRRVGRDRSWIATTIIVTYGLAILGVIVFIILSAPNCSGVSDACLAASGSWDKQAAMLHDLVITAVLPIVTLMLGFYFGTENLRGSASQDSQ